MSADLRPRGLSARDIDDVLLRGTLSRRARVTIELFDCRADWYGIEMDPRVYAIDGQWSTSCAAAPLWLRIAT